MISVVLFSLYLLICLVLVPLGLPGTWLMVGGALLYGPLSGGDGIGVFTLVGTAALALTGELIEYHYSVKYTRRYGGSRRAGWGAIIGGIAGAIIGIPVPVIGSVLGAFAGAFAGAFVAELTVGAAPADATRAAKGAFMGRIFGTAMKCALGVLMAIWLLTAAATG